MDRPHADNIDPNIYLNISTLLLPATRVCRAAATAAAWRCDDICPHGHPLGGRRRTHRVP
eukprot:4293959-Amphidinium_carterae.1